MSTAIETLPKLPAFGDHDNEAIADYIATELKKAKDEATEALEQTEFAFLRLWKVGKACLVISERVGGEAAWIDFAEKNLDEQFLFPALKCIEIAKLNPERPPLRGGNMSSAFKQLMISFAQEEAPRQTPRKTDHHSLKNFYAASDAIKRWWRDGAVLDALTPGMRKDVLKEFVLLAVMKDTIEERIKADEG